MASGKRDIVEILVMVEKNINTNEGLKFYILRVNFTLS